MNAVAQPADPRPLWHAQITALCMTLAALCELVPWGTTDIGRLPSHVIRVAQSLVHELVDECVRGEETRGKRARRELLQQADARLWELLKAFRSRHAARHEGLDFDPYRDRKAILEWGARLDDDSRGTNSPR